MQTITKLYPILLTGAVCLISASAFSQADSETIAVSATLEETATFVNVGATTLNFSTQAIPDLGEATAYYGNAVVNVSWEVSPASNFHIDDLH